MTETFARFIAGPARPRGRSGCGERWPLITVIEIALAARVSAINRIDQLSGQVELGCQTGDFDSVVDIIGSNSVR